MRSVEYVSILAKIKIPALLRQKNAGISKAQKFICEQFDPNQCACDLAIREVGDSRNGSRAFLFGKVGGEAL